MTRTEAKTSIASIMALRKRITDQIAPPIVTVYLISNGDDRTTQISMGIYYDSRSLRIATALFDTPENVPEKAPMFWEEINYRKDVCITSEAFRTRLTYKEGENGCI